MCRGVGCRDVSLVKMDVGPRYGEMKPQTQTHYRAFHPTGACICVRERGGDMGSRLAAHQSHMRRGVDPVGLLQGYLRYDFQAV